MIIINFLITLLYNSLLILNNKIIKMLIEKCLLIR